LRFPGRIAAGGTLCALACLGAPARADPPSQLEKPPELEKNAISYEPFAISSRGLLVQYERLIARRFSLVGGLGARFAARGDFSSTTLVLHGEGRYWIAGRDPLSDVHGLAGPFLALAFDAGRTTLHDRVEDRSVGAGWTLVESPRFGYRVVALGVQEISLALGFDVVHEIDEQGRLASNTRVALLSFVVTVGWVF
jgi:hypothetical protein